MFNPALYELICLLTLKKADRNTPSQMHCHVLDAVNVKLREMTAIVKLTKQKLRYKMPGEASKHNSINRLCHIYKSLVSVF
jgi:hypothetical protein